MHEHSAHYKRVAGACILLKNITLSADQELIRRAREKARREHSTLNANFRRWLRQYVNKNSKPDDFKALMESLKYARTDRKFSREELNER
jgi:hypothetical protein